MLNEILSRGRRIGETFRREKLGYTRAVIGGLVFVTSQIVFIASGMLLLFCLGGTLYFDPPSVVDPIKDDGFGFLFNRWFWVSAFLASIIGQIYGYYEHPTAQLERKIGAQAVAEYKRKYDWPWS